MPSHYVSLPIFGLQLLKDEMTTKYQLIFC
jgi:hypothetical protein